MAGELEGGEMWWQEIINAILEEGAVPKVATYTRKMSDGNKRRATKVIFSDGCEVRFLSLVNKRAAIWQAKVEHWTRRTHGID